jgi:hypothetical protein
MTVTETLNKTAGRFTTLIVNRKKSGNTKYCAQIDGTSNKTVSFLDVNANTHRRVMANNIVFARSGKLQYRRPHNKKT